VSTVLNDIEKYRTICLVHRFLYYVLDDPLISDAAYDRFERTLKALVEANPQTASRAPLAGICPLSRPGSSIAEDYPRRIEILAESLRAFARRKGTEEH